MTFYTLFNRGHRSREGGVKTKLTQGLYFNGNVSTGSYCCISISFLKKMRNGQYSLKSLCNLLSTKIEVSHHGGHIISRL